MATSTPAGTATPSCTGQKKLRASSRVLSKRLFPVSRRSVSPIATGLMLPFGLGTATSAAPPKVGATEAQAFPCARRLIALGVLACCQPSQGRKRPEGAEPSGQMARPQCQQGTRAAPAERCRRQRQQLVSPRKGHETARCCMPGGRSLHATLSRIELSPAPPLAMGSFPKALTYSVPGVSGHSSAMLSPTAGRSSKDTLGKHEDFAPGLFTVVARNGRKGPRQGAAPGVPGSSRDMAKAAGEGCCQAAAGAAAMSARPSAALASGRQVGCTPNRAETLKPQTVQRCPVVGASQEEHLPPTCQQGGHRCARGWL